MTAIDWTDQKLDHRLTCYMVDPNNHDVILDVLELDLTGNQVTWGYETNTKVSAKISITDWNQYIDNAWIRLVHTIDGTDYERSLFTGFIWDDGMFYKSSVYGASPSLMGSLKALELDKLTAPITIGEGAFAKNLLKNILDKSGQDYHIASNTGNYRYTDTSVMDAGEKILDCVQNVCETASCEYHVSGDGVIQIVRYIIPSTANPKLEIDSNAGNTVVLAANLSHSTTRRQVASRSIVVYKQDEDVMVSYADVSSKHQASPKRRGYTVAEVHEVRDLAEPVTQKSLSDLAKEYLTEDSASSTEWSVTCMWLPLEEGDVVMFAPPGQDMRKCLCKTVDADLHAWTVGLTLQEVDNG